MQQSGASTPTVLFITDNGHGLGHLTRMMAVARQAHGRFRPVFFTLSEGFPILREFGFAGEYFPSFRRLGVAKADWQPVFASRVRTLLDWVRPRVAVVDHVVPPTVLADLRAASPGVDFIWSRRGMWREGGNAHILPMFDAFDAIIEPGDIAAPFDRGYTARYRKGVIAIPPVILLGEEERLGRDEARRFLGMPADGRAVLIQMSHSDPLELASLIGSVRDTIRREAGDEEIHLFSPLHVLHRTKMPSVDGVTAKPVYPMARYMRAFDCVVSTAGYNSFHEVVDSGLPAVFVARDTNSLDDQERRAVFADLCGRAFHAKSVAGADFRRGVRRMLAPGEALVSAMVTEELGLFDGAVAFAEAIATRCEESAEPEIRTGGIEADAYDRREGADELPSMGDLPPYALKRTRGVIVIAVGSEEKALIDAAAQLSSWREMRHRSGPVFLVDNTVDLQSFDDPGFQFETIMSGPEWEQVGNVGYEEYLRSRIGELRSRPASAGALMVTP